MKCIHASLAVIFLAIFSTASSALVFKVDEENVEVLRAVQLKDDKEIFSSYTLSGPVIPHNDERTLKDDDGFFSIALAIHAFNTNKISRLAASKEDLRIFSEKALSFLAQKMPGYLQRSLEKIMKPLKDELKCVLDTSPVDINKCLGLIEAIKQFQGLSPLHGLPDAIAKLQAQADKLTDQEWYAALSKNIIAPSSGDFYYCMSRLEPASFDICLLMNSEQFAFTQFKFTLNAAQHTSANRPKALSVLWSDEKQD